MEGSVFTVWITKYVLTQGLIEKEVRFGLDDEKYVFSTDEFRQIFAPKDWHRTKEEAIERAKRIIEAKRKTIQKQLRKLDQLEKEIGG